MTIRAFTLFSSRISMISGLIFKSLIHFKLIFVNGVKLGQISLFCICFYSFPSTMCWRHCFPTGSFLDLLLNFSWPYLPGFNSGLSFLFHWFCVYLCARTCIRWLIVFMVKYKSNPNTWSMVAFIPDFFWWSSHWNLSPHPTFKHLLLKLSYHLNKNIKEVQVGGILHH